MIFFDLDNTLLDDDRATSCGLDLLHSTFAHAMVGARPEIDVRWQQLLRQHYGRFLRGEITLPELRRLRMRGLLHDDFATTLSDEDVDHAYSYYLSGYEGGWQPYHDALATLGALSRHQLGIITNGHLAMQSRKLAQTGIDKFFSVIVTSDECGAAKPDARIFAEACRRGGAEPSDCIHVGDVWDADVIGALRSGLQPIWISRVVADERVVPDSVKVISQLNELPALLDIMLA